MPITVFKPGDSTQVTAPDPAAYLPYLMGQASHGAHFTNVTMTTVGGQPATLLTATADRALDGGLGCQKKGLAAGDCYGLQPFLSLRLAVIPRASQTLPIWLRSGTADTETARTANAEAFERMLTTIKFRDRTVDTPSSS